MFDLGAAGVLLRIRRSTQRPRRPQRTTPVKRCDLCVLCVQTLWF